MNIYSSKKILIVDDEPDVRTYLKSALEDYGFDVQTAFDGFDALEKLENFTPDLISLDLVMPRHSGIKFYRDLKKNKEWAKIPVLIVTGHAKDDLGKADFDAMIMQGPGVYLEKPVKPNNYVATICQMLDIESPVKIQDDTELNTEQLREELLKNLSTADTEALQKALEALKKG